MVTLEKYICPYNILLSLVNWRLDIILQMIKTNQKVQNAEN